MIIKNKMIPNWGIFIIDVFVIVFSLVLSFNLRFNFHVSPDVYREFVYILPLVVAIRSIFFFIFKTYAGIIRYTSIQDALKIFLANASSTLFIVLVNVVALELRGEHLIPFAVVYIDFFLTIFFMGGIRIGYKMIYNHLVGPEKGAETTNVLIYGAGEAGIITKRTLDRDAGTKYKIKGFVDDNPVLNGKRIEGKRVFLTDKYLDSLLRLKEVDLMIISIQNLSVERKNEIVDLCLKYKVKVLNVPPHSKWINGELSLNQIKLIKIEDLLQRKQIRLDEDKIRAEVFRKRILVTGAAGSIGSEIVRQVIKYQPSKVILLDQAETPLFQMELELQQIAKQVGVEIVMGDIRNRDRMENLFRTYKPQVVYHAAAYKHVPMMEHNPSEAVLTNVLGTKILADLAVEYDVKKFVFVSTDKAVNPTNVMGATKRVAEIYVQSLDKYERENRGNEGTRFVTTRFGNVLGSNGSVITLFRKQIESGGPVTVTDPDITRYFMTIPEACQLVLEAGAIGNGGEIFVFDMGTSVKIVDLAKKMIELSGLELGKDIQLVFTGLRSGEKLYEELLNDEENTIATHHPKIMIGRVRQYSYKDISKDISELIGLFDTQKNDLIVGKLKKIVPEFVSNNSIYQSLDVKLK